MTKFHERQDDGSWVEKDEPLVTRTGRVLTDEDIRVLADEQASAEAVVAALAAASPVYDHMCCFFCGALTPRAVPNPAETPEDGEDHDDGCPWWMARRFVGRPKWPTAEEPGR